MDEIADDVMRREHERPHGHPPLRARPDDILRLAQHFTNKIAARTGKPVIGVGSAAARALLDYDWPGNVRELENVIERAIALTGSDEITLDDLPHKLREHRRSVLVTATGLKTPQAVEARSSVIEVDADADEILARTRVAA